MISSSAVGLDRDGESMRREAYGLALKFFSATQDSRPALFKCRPFGTAFARNFTFRGALKVRIVSAHGSPTMQPLLGTPQRKTV